MPPQNPRPALARVLLFLFAMTRWITRGILGVATLFACACTATASGYDAYGNYTVSASVSSPSLAYVGPGLWVVEGWNEPVFYSDGYYWRYRDSVWYRSPRWDSGWVYVRPYGVPRIVRGIDRPRVYANYYARPGVRVRTGPSGRVYVRDRRDYDVVRRRQYDYRTRRYYDSRDYRGRYDGGYRGRTYDDRYRGRRYVDRDRRYNDRRDDRDRRRRDDRGRERDRRERDRRD
jgi:hypothetical protein